MSERLRLIRGGITRVETGNSNHHLQKVHAIKARRRKLFAAGQEGALQAM